MECDTVLVRYGEIFLKSDWVRRSFTHRLMQNLKHALGRDGIANSSHELRMRIILKAASAQAAAQRASMVFGVHSASPAVESPSEIGGLTARAVEYAGGVLGEGSFAVRAKRTKDYQLPSQAIERLLGAAIQARYGNRVDLGSPDTTVGVEIHSETAFIYSKTVDGVGGLPYGTQGALVAAAAGRMGALAAWMMMRRGCSMMLAGRWEQAEDLNRFASPDLAEHASVGCALAAGASGVVVPQTVRDLDFSVDASLRVPVHRPLIGLDPRQVEAFLRLSGL
jgi:tRNA uracil 4-sulfurtransferase